jgi:hypothetical protein
MKLITSEPHWGFLNDNLNIFCLFICEFSYSWLVKMYQKLLFALLWIIFLHLFSDLIKLGLKSTKNGRFWPNSAPSWIAVLLFGVLWQYYGKLHRQSVHLNIFPNKMFLKASISLNILSEIKSHKQVLKGYLLRS